MERNTLIGWLSAIGGATLIWLALSQTNSIKQWVEERDGDWSAGRVWFVIIGFGLILNALMVAFSR